MLDNFTRIMIAGGAGFIGSHICDEVLKYGKQVVVIDNLSTGREDNLPPGIEFVKKNIALDDRFSDSIRGVDLIFHVAAQPSTRISMENPGLDFRSNALGTFNVLKAALENGVKKVIYTSSSAVYGEPEKLPLSETALPVPATPYGASKLCGENYCIAFNRAFGLSCTCLRPFNVYGTRENIETSLDEVVQYTLAISQGRPIIVNGDGSQTRDFVHVKDVVQAHILAADNDESVGKIFNIGTGLETSIYDLVQKIEDMTGNKAIVQQKPWSKGDILHEYGDISRARKILGYSPKTGLVEGLGELVSNLKYCIA